MKRGERQLHLPLDTDCPDDPKLPRLRDRPLEQRSLADARLSMHHQDPAIAAARRLEQPTERLALALPAEQLASRRLVSIRTSQPIYGRAPAVHSPASPTAPMTKDDTRVAD